MTTVIAPLGASPTVQPAWAPVPPPKPVVPTDHVDLSQEAESEPTWTPAQTNAVHALQSADLFKRPLRPGDRGDVVRRFKQGLGIADPTFKSDSDVFDPATDQAVRQYQQQHGLTPDGVVGGKTYGTLWHDLYWNHNTAHDLVDPSVYKNLPPGLKVSVNTADGSMGGQRINLQDKDGNVIRQYPTSTGSERYPTPHGTFKVQSITEKPWWNPPNSTWAAGAHRTPPGPNNPVGNVKMNVVGAVYMHGVPPKEYDSIGHTSESHGCMRMFQSDAWQLSRIIRPGTPVEIH